MPESSHILNINISLLNVNGFLGNSFFLHIIFCLLSVVNYLTYRIMTINFLTASVYSFCYLHTLAFTRSSLVYV